jgi:hypothetical protein
MRKAHVALTAVGIVVAVAGGAIAQSDRAKKHPHQTPDRGVDDTTKPVEDQGKKAIGEHDVAAVAVSVHANGMKSAELDESFEEALLLTVGPDGRRTYACIHGLPAGADHSSLAAAPPVAPALEEK